LAAGFAAEVRLDATVRLAAGLAADDRLAAGLAVVAFAAEDRDTLALPVVGLAVVALVAVFGVAVARPDAALARERLVVPPPAAVLAAAARLAVPARLAVLGADAARLAAVRLVASDSAMGFPPVGNLKSVGNSRCAPGSKRRGEHQGCSPCQRSSSASQIALRWSTSSSARAASASVRYGPRRSTAGQIFASDSTRLCFMHQ
jgi:hypothetical protein